jgi:hypothetical protein
VTAKGRCNEIAAQKHFAGDLGVARFVGTHEWHVTKTVKVEGDHGEK